MYTLESFLNDILKIASFSLMYFRNSADDVHTAVEVAGKSSHVNFFVHFKPGAVQQLSNTDIVPKHAFYVGKRLGEMRLDQKGAARYVFKYDCYHHCLRHICAFHD